MQEYVHWMTYWIVFALWTLGEEMVDLFLAFWWPLYWECKVQQPHEILNHNPTYDIVFLTILQ